MQLDALVAALVDPWSSSEPFINRAFDMTDRVRSIRRPGEAVTVMFARFVPTDIPTAFHPQATKQIANLFTAICQAIARESDKLLRDLLPYDTRLRGRLRLIIDQQYFGDPKRMLLEGYGEKPSTELASQIGYECRVYWYLAGSIIRILFNHDTYYTDTLKRLIHQREGDTQPTQLNLRPLMFPRSQDLLEARLRTFLGTTPSIELISRFGTVRAEVSSKDKYRFQRRVGDYETADKFITLEQELYRFPSGAECFFEVRAKGLFRTWVKMFEARRGSVGYTPDIFGVRIVVLDPKRFEDVLDDLRTFLHQDPVPRRQNADADKDYWDRKFRLKIDGVWTEVQVMTLQVFMDMTFAAAGINHDLYLLRRMWKFLPLLRPKADLLWNETWDGTAKKHATLALLAWKQKWTRRRVVS